MSLIPSTPTNFMSVLASLSISDLKWYRGDEYGNPKGWYMYITRIDPRASMKPTEVVYEGYVGKTLGEYTGPVSEVLEQLHVGAIEYLQKENQMEVNGLVWIPAGWYAYINFNGIGRRCVWVGE